MWQQGLLTGPGDLWLRSRVLDSQGSPSWTSETWFESFQCLVFIHLVTSVCTSLHQEVVKTRLIMVSQVCVSFSDSQVNVNSFTSSIVVVD